jgi:hypothetical protein
MQQIYNYIISFTKFYMFLLGKGYEIPRLRVTFVLVHSGILLILPYPTFPPFALLYG